MNVSMSVLNHPLSPMFSLTNTSPSSLRGIYYWAIDTTVAEIDDFQLTSCAVLKAVAKFIPGTDRFLYSDALLSLARQYKTNIGDLSIELQQIHRII